MTFQTFHDYPDLASRALAGSVIWASDEAFAEKENLITPGDAEFDPGAFGHKGKVYDGWETRRRRGAEIGGFDSAIIRLGIPGEIHGITVDTSWFTGNFPPQIAVWGICVHELHTGEEMAQIPDAEWFPLVPLFDARGDHKHDFDVSERRRVSHVRLDMIPDGGITRLRVHGIPRPKLAFLTGTIDLAAAEYGGRVIDCSNRFYSSPDNILGLGRSRNMGEGWENARRRSGDNDYVTVQLAGEGVIRRVEMDTSYFLHNAPDEAELIGIAADGTETTVIPRARVLPDTRHYYAVEGAASGPFTSVRLNVFPDGGLSRLRIFGELTENGFETLRSVY
ncbi:allantoicase [Corynebacterium pacaense]|uniref:allantoicase n=1 Tax=Corynebacterium pacaense TaxID=1816684 RepID=UPI0009BB0FAD|nr:allantoicase [Corynebacterium pacaense]